MVGSEKACKFDFHVGIVRANKMQVNDYFGGVKFLGKIVLGVTNFDENVYNRFRIRSAYD